MDHKRRARLALVGVGLLAAACGSASDPEPAAYEDRPARLPISHEFAVEGLWLEGAGTGPDDPSVRIEAGKMVARHRRIGVLAIWPMKEVLLAEARVDVVLPGSGARVAGRGAVPAIGLPGRLFDMPVVKAVSGVVTRVVTESLDLQIEDANGPLFRIAADAATARWRRRYVDLRDLRVASREGQRLEAPVGRWYDGETGLAVGAGWSLEGGEQRQEGDAVALFRLARSGRLEAAPPPAAQDR